MNYQNNGNNNEVHTCCSRSRDCVVYITVVTFSTFVFVASMILTVYFTYTASLDKAIVVLIVGSCLLFLLGFCGNMYSIYVSTPNIGPSESRENSNRSSQTIDSSTHSTSTNIRGLDLLNIPRAREVFQVTPPPPYEIQMSEMSRMLRPGTSRPTESSAREAEIVQEAHKLIQKLYEDMKRTGQLEPQSSTDVQPVQQTVQTPKTPIRQQQTMSSKVSHQSLVVQKQQAVAKSSPGRGIPQSSINEKPVKKVLESPETPLRQQPMISPKVSHQNLVVQKQQTVAKSSPGRGIPPAGFGTNPVIQQKGAQSYLPTQLDLGRLLIGSKGCSAINPQLSSPFPGRPPVDFGMKQVAQQTPNSPPTQPNLERFVIANDGCVVSPPQMSPRRESVLIANKRKLTSPINQQQTRPNSKENVTQISAIDNHVQCNEYEEIEVLENIQSENSSQRTYDSVESCCTESGFEEPSEHSSSVASGTSEHSLEQREKSFLTPNVEEPRQLSVQSTRKFCQLGISPQTVLNAIVACPELDGDEWMAAWNLCLQNVPPVERARILGLRLQEEGVLQC